ncbi:hypothetical protein CYMTET_16265 [Cymbomonas tetramitiformis]|uniref:Uncharacterized protein n=1 Tax=Cymbomonas tetramitiformis TaxID=36881 RepID=A0AAE0GCL7_9CHLO|nr:hypothetical protein CYMTET_16265 [Cymbomonas tetramitiformis]
MTSNPTVSTHPAPLDVSWEDLREIVVVHDKLKDSAETWCIKVVQEFVREEKDPYVLYELAKLRIGTRAVVAAVKAASLKTKALEDGESSSVALPQISRPRQQANSVKQQRSKEVTPPRREMSTAKIGWDSTHFEQLTDIQGPKVGISSEASRGSVEESCSSKVRDPYCKYLALQQQQMKKEPMTEQMQASLHSLAVQADRIDGCSKLNKVTATNTEIMEKRVHFEGSDTHATANGDYGVFP